jgi:hypothetical protein
MALIPAKNKNTISKLEFKLWDARDSRLNLFGIVL